MARPLFTRRPMFRNAVELIAEVPAHVGDTKPCVYPPGCFFPIDAFEKQAL
jgi:hypothetical protein